MSGGCGCRAPGTPERSWETYPVVNLRLGYAFWAVTTSRRSPPALSRCN